MVASKANKESNKFNKTLDNQKMKSTCKEEMKYAMRLMSNRTLIIFLSGKVAIFRKTSSEKEREREREGVRIALEITLIAQTT